jgi:hypothetical protein
MDDEDHWLLFAHLGPGLLYVIDVQTNKVVKTVAGVPGITTPDDVYSWTSKPCSAELTPTPGYHRPTRIGTTPRTVTVLSREQFSKRDEAKYKEPHPDQTWRHALS